MFDEIMENESLIQILMMFGLLILIMFLSPFISVMTYSSNMTETTQTAIRYIAVGLLLFIVFLVGKFYMENNG